MTKPTPSKPLTPFNRFKATYTPLYRVLLILGALAILISLGGIMNIRNLFDTFGADPFFSLSGLISTLIALPLMIASLILLAHKHPMGIRLRLSGYAVAIAGAVVGLFSSESTIARIAQEAFDGAKQQSTTEITLDMVTHATEFTLYATFYLSIGASLLFAQLWWKAWKRQCKVDAKRKKTPA